MTFSTSQTAGWFAAVFFLTCSSMSCTSGQCESTELGCRDCYTWCPSYPELCETEPIIQQSCRETCQICSLHPLCSEAKCEHRCLLNLENQTAECTCFEGYTMNEDGRTCTDIDECALEVNPCTTKRSPICKNTDGGYLCVDCSVFDVKNIWRYYNRTECCRRDHDSRCGRSWLAGGRFSINPETERLRRWPWTAFITVSGNRCDGALIDDRFVLTAAHCLDGVFNSNQITTELGLSNTGSNRRVTSQSFSVQQFHRHPNYTLPHNDIAVLELARDVIHSETTRPVCLPGGHEPSVGEICYTTGYGTARLNGSTLQEVGLSVSNRTICKRAFENEQHAMNSICTERCKGEDGEKVPCSGFSGGPLVCQRCNSCDWYIAGVASFGEEYGLSGSYGVYARVVAFEEWITSITNQPFSQSSCVKARWDEWSQWSSCSKSCGQDTRTRSRRCLNGVPGVTGCLGSETTKKSCYLSDCPLFSEWSEFSDCTKSCDGGVQTRIRTCPQPGLCPADAYGTTTEETRECNIQQCPGEWTPWEPVGECSETCGDGMQTEGRRCEGGAVGSEGCMGRDLRMVPCNLGECPAEWSEYSEFSKCTASCGGGTRTRTRYCVGSGIGTGNCIGTDLQTESCNTNTCSAQICESHTNADEEQCCRYANIGHCSTYNAFMSIYCQRACCELRNNLPCTDSNKEEEKACGNLNGDSYCYQYRLHCHVPYIRDNCREACGRC